MPRGYTKFGENVEKSFQSVDINSRKELEDIAEEEKLDINFNEWWELWDELVTKTKQDITKELKKQPIAQKNGRVAPRIYVYNFKQKLVKTFSSPQEAADYYSIRREQVTNYAREEKPYYKLQIIFKYVQINE